MARDSSITGGFDLAVDFMDMSEDRRLWTRATDAATDVELAPGRYVIVGDDDADPRVARIVSVDLDGNIELEVLRGSVESHVSLLTTA
jgi:hypothetical protein